jgi:hypothetical protein
MHSLGPLPRATLYDRVCKGLRNYYGEHNVSQSRSALSLSDLCCFRAHLDLNSFEGSRNWCAYLFAFFGLLRLREFCSPALTFHDVTPQRYGIDITVAFSKTCLVPVQVVLVRRDDHLCPLAAYQQYVRHIDYRLRLANSPFFRLTASRTKPLEPSVFIRGLRSLIQSALPDRDPSEFAGHSFRRGGTTSMFMSLVPWTLEITGVSTILRQSATTAYARDSPSTACSRTTTFSVCPSSKLMSTASLLAHSPVLPLAPHSSLSPSSLLGVFCCS